jgi:molecular chaperone DnaK
VSDARRIVVRRKYGEAQGARDNRLLGVFQLGNIPPAPRGIPQIEVTFDIDANGIVNVQASDKATGKEQSIRIQASGGLTEADINRMVKEAESHAEEDKKRREMVEIKNQAEALVHSTERMLKDYGDKVPAGDKSLVETAVADLKSALQGDDTDAIKQKTNALAQASMRLGEAMYQANQGQAAGGGPSAEAGGSDDKVVDVDFEEVKDDDSKKSA